MKYSNLESKILLGGIINLSLLVAVLLFADTLECMGKNVSELDGYCLYLLNK